uniref:ribonuclease H n=1 Tax=viral metagenome TaxID=1070528 RepID=A0A6C0KWW7_9ZZZZ
MSILKQFGIEIAFKKKSKLIETLDIGGNGSSGSGSGKGSGKGRGEGGCGEIKNETCDVFPLMSSMKKRENEPPSDGVIVFTDGASKGNGSKHSRSGCAAIFPNHLELNITHTLPVGSTNNRAEYTAVQLALEQVDREDSMKRKTVYIYTDSQLIVDSMSKWITQWKRNGWKKKDGKPVLNQDILKRIDDLSQLRRVVYKHVMAHTGRDDWESVWNDRADKEANKAALAHEAHAKKINDYF